MNGTAAKTKAGIPAKDIRPIATKTVESYHVSTLSRNDSAVRRRWIIPGRRGRA